MPLNENQETCPPLLVMLPFFTLEELFPFPPTGSGGFYVDHPRLEPNVPRKTIRGRRR